VTAAHLIARSSTGEIYLDSEPAVEVEGGALIYFKIDANELAASDSTFFEVQIETTIETVKTYQSIYSEFYSLKMTTDSDVNRLQITAKNNDNRHGFLMNEAFGFFETVGLNEDFFINSKTEYEYSYGRKKILSAENNIGRRITFKNLSAYNQNLLKWLCNCENLYFNGIKYQLISDFSEILNDDSSEICDLRADFVLAEQNFFKTGKATIPKNIFTKEFFIK
jgi:hypothetical protein